MSAPRIPNSIEYWKNKGKIGKKAAIYFHDDLDGIYSAIVMRNYLENNGFEIVAYGVVNYIDGWKNVEIHDGLINVAVDYAENHPSMDVYIDHHGTQYGSENTDFAVKTATSSAYEGICYQLGIPVDELVMASIDMVDSAKYPEYNLSFKDTMILEKDHYYQSRLHFTASLNQIIKRGCWHTLIEVVHNTKDLSVYEIFNNFKKYYPYNNLDYRTNQPKDFIEDGKWRIGEMIKRTRGDLTNGKKTVFVTQQQFIGVNFNNNSWNLSGYQIIGNVAFIPSGVWANAIRARGILEKDIEEGIIPKNQVKFIVLQYGSTIQMVCYGKINELDEYYLPRYKKDVIKNGVVVKKAGELTTNIGEYMEYVLYYMKKDLGYTDISTFIGSSDDEVTVAGGHGGIGTISNIVGFVGSGNCKNLKYLDFVKNKIIMDFANIDWSNFKMRWSYEKENGQKRLVNRFKRIGDVRTQEDLEFFKKKYNVLK